MKGPSTSNTCFGCHKLGHFFKDCPEITPKRTPTSHPSFSTSSDPDFPTIHCRCRAGLCHIRVSKSENNPGRKYYRCPGNYEKSCQYFKWCDELREDEVRKSQPETNFPDCGCGAGVCTIRVQDSGPHKGRTFFACPIKKGDGACNFKQWRDEDVGQSRLLDEFDLSYNEEMQINAIEMRTRDNDKASDVDDNISARSDMIHSRTYQPVENETIQNSVGLESTTQSPLNYSVTTAVANPHNPASPGFENMSANSSTGTNVQLTCNHDLPLVREICKNRPNKGNKFFGCPLWKVNQSCNFFKWDEEGNESSKTMESDLSIELKMMKNDIKSLNEQISKEKGKRKRLEDEIKVLKEANVELKLKLSQAPKWSVMFVIVIFVFIMKVI